MASKIRIERQIQEKEALVSRWQSRAQMAVERGRDDLAREALVEKRKESEMLAALSSEVKNYDELISQSRSEIDQLETKLAQAKSKLRLLQQKAQAARKAGPAERPLEASRVHNC